MKIYYFDSLRFFILDQNWKNVEKNLKKILT
jgi:hypothetical protein